MNEAPFMDVVKEICERDSRYDSEAYVFVREALDFTVDMLQKPRSGSEEQRHVTGPELLEGIRTFAIQEFGPMTLTMFDTWGIKKTEDFGEIVFNLVESGKLGSREEDKRENFANGYNFQEVFEKPFLPRNPAPKKKTRRKRA